MTVLVTGATGYVAQATLPALAARGPVLAQSRRAGPGIDVVADLHDVDALAATFEHHGVSAVLNLAAAADVDGCEADPAWAEEANVAVVADVAEACRRTGVALVHVSTDQVYDGPGPHPEDDVAIVNVYARTKRAGEVVALDAGATVVRVNVIGRSRRPGRPAFTDVVVDAVTSGRGMTVFEDSWFSPLHQDVLGEHLSALCAVPRPGLWNLGSRDGASKAVVAERLARALGLGTQLLRRGRVADVELRAPRPGDMRMDVSRLEAAMGTPLPDLESQIVRTAEEYADVRA